MSEAAGREPSARVGNGCNRSPAPCGGLAWRQRHAIPARQGNPREPFDSCEKILSISVFLNAHRAAARGRLPTLRQARWGWRPRPLPERL